MDLFNLQLGRSRDPLTCKSNLTYCGHFWFGIAFVYGVIRSKDFVLGILETATGRVAKSNPIS